MLSANSFHKNFFLFCILLLTQTNRVRNHEQTNYIRELKTILSANKPIVLLLNKNAPESSSDFDNLFNDNEDRLLENNDNDDEGLDRIYASYLLHQFLRTDTTNEFDSSVEDTKQMLRTALRARCNKVEKCVRKCPQKRPSCPKKCQKVFDSSNLCSPPPKPKKCKKPRCGKTMPPKWRF